MGLMVDSSERTFLPTLKSRDTEVGQISKMRPDKIEMLCPSLRIHGQLPAAIVNGGGDSFWKWPDFQLWRARDLDHGSGHATYRHASIIDLYLRAKCN